MGCVVNGPGEAREADLGIAAGRKRGHLFVKGEVVKVVPESRDGRRRSSSGPHIIDEGGVEAALARKDAGAAAEADADRAALLDEKGDDANQAGRAHPDHPQARRELTATPGGAVRGGAVASAPYGQAPRAHPPGGGLPPLVPGRRRQGGDGRQRAGAGHHGHPSRTATPSGSRCRPRSTAASRPRGPRTPTSRCSSPRAT